MCPIFFKDVKKYKFKIWMTLFLILGLGLFLRLHQLGKESFFLDEVLTIIDSSCPIPELVKRVFFHDNFPPYFILMHYWIKIFGKGEFALRFPSAIFGFMSIYLIFILGRKLFNEKIGLFSSYLFAVSTINIFYSQMARPYTMTAFFVILSFLFFFEALDKNTKLFWTSYILFTLWALFLSATVTLILLIQILFIIILWKRYKKIININQIFCIFSFIFFIYLPFLITMILLSFKHNSCIKPFNCLNSPSFANILDTFNLFGGKIYYQRIRYPIDNNFIDILTDIFGICFFSFCLIGIFVSSKFKNGLNKRQFSGTLLSSLWLFIPIVLPFIFSKFFFPVFGVVRYVLYTSAAYYLLIAKGIIFFRKKIYFVTFFIIFLGFMFLQQYYTAEKRTPWREISNYIKTNIKDNEKTAFIINNYVSYNEHLMLSFYSAPSIIGIAATDEALEKWSDSSIFEKFPAGAYNKTLKLIECRLENLNYDGIWFIVVRSSASRSTDWRSTLSNKLQNKYTLAEEKKFFDASLYHFKITMR